MNIIIFGAGRAGTKICHDINANYQSFDKMICVLDNDRNKWGKFIENYEVVSPDRVQEYDYDKIIVCGMYWKAFEEQLKAIGVDEDNIISESYYYGIIHTRKVYQRRNYSENHKMIKGRIAVYSAITGDYDEIIEPEYIDPMIDYVCFTNNKAIKSKRWNIEYISDSNLDNMYLAKKVKLFPNDFFKEYEISVWVDAKYKIKNSFISYAEKYLRNSGMLFFPHPDRECIYSEAAECIRYGKGNKEDILKQISSYYNDGYPLDNGLYEGGCIVRYHNDSFVKKLMSEWWEQICKFSYRDQLSLPYVFWKNNFLPDICDLNINNNMYTKVMHFH